MAEEQRESNILATGSIDIDVSDALKGLKALRREANETIKVLDQLSERLNKLPKDNSDKAVFNNAGEGLCVKGGSLTVNGSWENVKDIKTGKIADERLYPEKQIFEIGSEFTQIFIKSFTNYSRYLVINYEQLTTNEPIFFGFVRFDKYIRKTKTKERKFGKFILDLGEFDEGVKEIKLDIYACPLSGSSVKFMVNEIYFQH